MAKNYKVDYLSDDVYELIEISKWKVEDEFVSSESYMDFIPAMTGTKLA